MLKIFYYEAIMLHQQLHLFTSIKILLKVN